MAQQIARYVVLATILHCALLVKAQGIEIKGEVQDPTGAVIPNARVLLINLQTLDTKLITTDREGRFSFDKLTLYDYEVKVASQGFVTHSEDVKLSLSGNVVVVGAPEAPKTVMLSIKLRIGST